MLLSPPRTPSPPRVFTVASCSLRIEVWNRAICVCVWCFCLFVSELWENGSCKGGGQNTGSHLCLQVHDLLAHQGNGGTGFLPLHRLHLQRWCRHSLQVLPHPGRWGVGLSYALPRSLTWRLRLVLKRKRTEGKCLVVGEARKLYAEFFWWAFLISSTILHVCLRNEFKKSFFSKGLWFCDQYHEKCAQQLEITSNLITGSIVLFFLVLTPSYASLKLYRKKGNLIVSKTQ